MQKITFVELFFIVYYTFQFNSPASVFILLEIFLTAFVFQIVLVTDNNLAAEPLQVLKACVLKRTKRKQFGYECRGVQSGDDKPKIASENFIKRHHADRKKLRGEMPSVASRCRNLECVRPFTRRATRLGWLIQTGAQMSVLHPSRRRH